MSGEERIIGMLENVLEKLDKVEQRLDKLEQRMDKVEQRLDKVEETLEDLNDRVGNLERMGVAYYNQLADIKEDIEIVKEEAEITRAASNKLLDWAERTGPTINSPLYKLA